jgi:hypothetical protein
MLLELGWTSALTPAMPSPYPSCDTSPASLRLHALRCSQLFPPSEAGASALPVAEATGRAFALAGWTSCERCCLREAVDELFLPLL